MGNNFTKYRLGDIASFAYGKMPKKPLLGSGKYITYSGYRYIEPYPEKNASAGDVIVVARGVGGTGDVKLVSQDCYLTNLSIKISLNQQYLLNEYFYYVFHQKNLRYLDSGSAQSQITIADLSNIVLHVPCTEHQRNVINHLKKIDDKITLNRQINQTLEQMAQALFKSWFLDFDPVVDNALDAGFFEQNLDLPDELLRRAEARRLVRKQCDFKPLPDATRQLFPAAFEESTEPSLGLGGWVPKGWSVKTCEEISEKIGMGPFGSNIKTSTFVSHGIPIINGKQLSGFILDDEFSNYITPEHAMALSGSIVRAGDIILTHRGTIGQVSIIPNIGDFDEYIVSQSQFYLRPDRKKLGKNYLALFLRSATGQQELLSNSAQVGVPAIARPSSHLKQLKLITPTSLVQEKFEKLTDGYINEICLRKSELKTLARLRDTLLPKLISGELRLDNIGADLATE